MPITRGHLRKNFELIGVFSSAANYLAAIHKTAAEEGMCYYDTTLDQLRTHDGSSWSPAGQSGASAGSLDAAAQIGAKITNTQAIEIEASASSSNLLILDANGTTNVDILDISSAAGSGDLINLTQAGTGKDINGTSATWSVTKAGVAVFTGVDLGDDENLRFGASNDVVIDWNQTNLLIEAATDDTGQIRIGSTNSMDLAIYGSTNTKICTFDVSAAVIEMNGWDLNLQDDDILQFGDSNDVTMVWDQTDFLIDANAADSKFLVGKTNNIDLVIYGDTSTDAVTFDTSAEDVQFNGFDLTLQDDDILNFGDADDVTVTWDQTDLLVDGAAANSQIKIGATNNLDLLIYGATATNSVYFDTDDSTLEIKINGFDLRLQDDDYLLLGDSASAGGAVDGTIRWDSGSSEVEIIGATRFEQAVTFDSNVTVTGSLTHTGSYNPGELTLEQDEIFYWGDASNITMTFDGTNLVVDGAAANTGITIGATNNQDFTIYGGTATNSVVFDTDDSALTCSFNGFDLRLLDDDKLQFGDAQDMVFQWDQTDLAVDPAAANGVIHFGKSTDCDIKANGATTGADLHWDASADTLGILDAGKLGFGGTAAAPDVSVQWDKTNLLVEAATQDTGQIRIGSTNALDLAVYGSTATKIALFDVSTAILEMNGWDINLQDDDILQFGDANDITITWDQTRLNIDGAAADKEIRIGNTNNQDLLIYGATNTNVITFDTDDSALLCSFNGFDLRMQDDDVLSFGDADDITITWDQTRLNIDGAAADKEIRIGKTNNQDIIIYGDTTTDAITFDTSGEAVNFNGFDLTLEDDDVLKFGDAGDVTATWDQTNLLIEAAADNTGQIKVGTTNAIDLLIHGSTNTKQILFDVDTAIVEINDWDVNLQDDDVLQFGDAADITVVWDQTDLLVDAASADDKILVGKTNNIDLVIYGDTTTDAVTFDTSAEDVQFNGFDLSLQDEDYLNFGDSDDVTFQWDTSNLLIEAATDDTGAIHIGATNSLDLVVYGSTTSKTMTFDVSTAVLEINDWDINLQDDDVLQFGDAADITIVWDQTDLLIDAAAADDVIKIGATNNIDLIIYGDTATDYVEFDTSAEMCNFNGFDITMQDNDIIRFGDSGAESQIASNGTDTDWTISSGVVTLGDGGTTNYSSFDADGDLIQAGSASLERFKLNVVAKTTDYTVVANDTGTVFTTAGASGAVTFQLPAVATGLNYTFLAVADQSMTVSCTTNAADTMVILNDAAADSVSFGTASEKIGGGCKAICDGTYWIILPMNWSDDAIDQTWTTAT